MKFIFKFIEKVHTSFLCCLTGLCSPVQLMRRGGYNSQEKQAEAIIDKLCQRFQYTPQDPIYDALNQEERLKVDERRWRDISLVDIWIRWESLVKIQLTLRSLCQSVPVYAALQVRKVYQEATGCSAPVSRQVGRAHRLQTI